MSYQTYQTADGSIVKGFSPTIERFSHINKWVDFNGKNVLDLACNIGSFGMQAALAGALNVVGLDLNQEAVNKGNIIARSFPLPVKISCRDIESFEPSNTFDITIVSMIIHWLKKPQVCIKKFFNRTTDKFVLIYRFPTKTRGEVGWRPSVKELNILFGQEPYASVFFVQDKSDCVLMVIYDKRI